MLLLLFLRVGYWTMHRVNHTGFYFTHIYSELLVKPTSIQLSPACSPCQIGVHIDSLHKYCVYTYRICHASAFDMVCCQWSYRNAAATTDVAAAAPVAAITAVDDNIRIEDTKRSEKVGKTTLDSFQVNSTQLNSTHLTDGRRIEWNKKHAHFVDTPFYHFFAQHNNWMCIHVPEQLFLCFFE